ncbi:MATE family efflux transporter [uncultured Tateyamaria sp.]|uniref:MATE family efflux transporter n=1 Tax=uncultured Tateyamaria sp. TaxID=455651 RepID=UPI002632E390|nr:MATE family efflux transporter [uncultured Tateyamaria sp.]
MTADHPNYLHMVRRISFFAAISYAVDYSFQLIDMFWVAQLGAAAPTAITLVSVILFAVLALNEIVGVSTVSLFSQSVGRGDDVETGALILNCLVVKFVLGIAMVALFGAVLATTVWWQGLDGALRQLTLDYAWVIWPSLILVPVYSTIMTVLRTVGLEVTAAAISVMILAVNAVATPLLVLGYGDMQGFGIAGAAWATILSQVLALALSLAVLVKQRPALDVLRRAALAWQPALYRKLVLIGLPIGAMMVVYSLENLVLANLVLDYPVAVSDGFGIGARIFGFVFIINLGITVGVGIGAGRVLGAAGTSQAAAEAIRSGTQKLCLGLLVLGLLIWASAPLWLAAVLSTFTKTPETAETAALYIRVMLLTNCLFMVTYALNGVFEGSGVTWPILAAGLVSYGVIEFPLLFILHVHAPGNLLLLWGTICAAAAAGLAVTTVLFRLRFWDVNKDAAVVP